jgi:hypothetical protein
MIYEIPTHKGYFINESGVVINKKGELSRISVDNYDRIYITLEGKVTYIDQLVAETFLPNPNGYKYVSHRDGELLNCHVSNLYWSEEPQIIDKESIIHKRPRTIPRFKYEIYDDSRNISVICQGREELAKIIEYEVISLKNMVGNGRIISIGPYAGCQIRRLV